MSISARLLTTASNRSLPKDASRCASSRTKRVPPLLRARPSQGQEGRGAIDTNHGGALFRQGPGEVPFAAAQIADRQAATVVRSGEQRVGREAEHRRRVGQAGRDEGGIVVGDAVVDGSTHAAPCLAPWLAMRVGGPSHLHHRATVTIAGRYRARH